MRNRFMRIGGVAVLALGLSWADAALAQTVFDTVAVISDSKDTDAEAFLQNAGTTAFVDVQKICVEGEDSVAISSFSPHPDGTQAKQKLSARVEQKEKGNEPPIFVAGSGTMAFDVELACEKSHVRGDASLEKGQGRFGLKGKNCTGLTADQVIFVQDVCQTARNTKVKGSGDVLKQVQVKGKGSATEPML
jgi:hypothetical protein